MMKKTIVTGSRWSVGPDLVLRLISRLHTETVDPEKAGSSENLEIRILNR